MKNIKILLLSTSLLISNANANIELLTTSYINTKVNVSTMYNGDSLDTSFIDLKPVVTDRSHLAKIAATAAKAAYNDSGLYSKPIRIQHGNDAREQLAAEGHDVISFSATVPGYGNMPAGIVTYKEDAKGKPVITIAYHGTECDSDVFVDLDIFKTKTNEIGVDGKAQRGFFDRYKQSREALIDVLTTILEVKGKNAEDIQFIVTGHSLGGALATIAAADLKNGLAQKAELRLITFSSPRVFDSKAAYHVDQIIEGKGKRIWRFLDIVPAALLGIFGFDHVGESVTLEAETNFPSMANHSHDANLRDATSAEPVKILQHEGWRTWGSRMVSNVKSAVTSTVKKSSSWLPF